MSPQPGAALPALRRVPGLTLATYCLLWRGRRGLLRAAALPLLVLLVVNFGLAKAYGPRWVLEQALAADEGRPADGWRLLGVALCHLFAHSLFAVAWFRALLSAGASEPALLPTPAGVHLRFQGMALLVGLCMAVLVALSVIVGGVAASYDLMAILGFVSCSYLAARWQLLWPGIVVNDPEGLKGSWNRLKGEMPTLWPLLVLVLVPPALLAFVGDALFHDARLRFLASGDWNPGAFLDSLLAAVAALLAFAAAAVPAADAYRRLDQGLPALL